MSVSLDYGMLVQPDHQEKSNNVGVTVSAI
jgi:hypothetical protein